MKDFAKQTEEELDKLQSVREFCQEWKTRWREIAVAVQAILKVIYPAGAKVMGFLIAIADSFCGGGNP